MENEKEYSNVFFLPKFAESLNFCITKIYETYVTLFGIFVLFSHNRVSCKRKEMGEK